MLTFLKTESESLRLSLTKFVKKLRYYYVSGIISEYSSSVREESSLIDSVYWASNYYIPIFYSTVGSGVSSPLKARSPEIKDSSKMMLWLSASSYLSLKLGLAVMNASRVLLLFRAICD
jgi:hypothetical protein